MDYGAEDHFLGKIIRQNPEDNIEASSEGNGEAREQFTKARAWMNSSYETAIRQLGDTKTLPFIHTILAFVLHCSRYPTVMTHVEADFHWELTATMLNGFLETCTSDRLIASEQFHGPYRSNTPRLLPEDYAMRGSIYMKNYYSSSWFCGSTFEEDAWYLELASMTEARRERLLWIGRRLADSGKWLTWDDEARKFGVTELYADYVVVHA